MQDNILLSERDKIIMNLAHYFITNENYNPIIIHGINDEIWLENMQQDYKVIRIVIRYIHNDEQLKYDIQKTRHITKKLKSKTFSLKMKVMNIYTDLGDNVHLDKFKDEITATYITDEKDVPGTILEKYFPKIKNKLKHKENGFEFFVKMTDEINYKSNENAKKINKIFSKKYPIVTYVIIAICIIMYLLMAILGNGSYDNLTLLKFGANLDLLTKSGQYYRLLTSIFLHIGIVHLIFNMYALFIIGPQIESFFGKLKYIFIYLFSGISGSILSICFTHNTISAGASGAIFGLLGAMLYFGYNYRNYLGNVLKSQIIPIILINLFLGSINPNIDNFAHIGGLVGGIIAAMAVGISNKSDKIETINGKIIAVIYILFIGYLAFIGI